MKSKYQSPDPLLIPIAAAFDMLGIGRTFGYELIKRGELETVKLGGKRLATRKSVEALATPAQQAA